MRDRGMDRYLNILKLIYIHKNLIRSVADVLFLPFPTQSTAVVLLDQDN